MPVKSSYYNKETLKREICDLIDQQDVFGYRLIKNAEPDGLVTVTAEIKMFYEPVPKEKVGATENEKPKLFTFQNGKKVEIDPKDCFVPIDPTKPNFKDILPKKEPNMILTYRGKPVTNLTDSEISEIVKALF
jgi:hypothetical protein